MEAPGDGLLIKANLAKIQPENYQNVQKTHFWQQAPGVNGLIIKTPSVSEYVCMRTCGLSTEFLNRMQ